MSSSSGRALRWRKDLTRLSLSEDEVVPEATGSKKLAVENCSRGLYATGEAVSGVSVRCRTIYRFSDDPTSTHMCVLLLPRMSVPS